MGRSRIGEFRRARGWTQERLASASGVAARTIQRLESGSNASLETLALIAEALDVRVAELSLCVEDAPFEVAISGCDARKRAQQRRRDAITHGAVLAFRGAGILVTLAIVVLVLTGALSWLGWLVIPAYWAGGHLVVQAVFRFVVDPRLDVRYPLSVPSLSLAGWTGVETLSCMSATMPPLPFSSLLYPNPQSLRQLSVSLGLISCGPSLS